MGVIALGVFWFFSMYKVYERTRMVGEMNQSLAGIDHESLSYLLKRDEDALACLLYELLVERKVKHHAVGNGEVWYTFDESNLIYQTESPRGQVEIMAFGEEAQELAIKQFGRRHSTFENGHVWNLRTS